MDASSSRPTPDELRPLLIDAAVSLALIGRQATDTNRGFPRSAVVAAASALTSPAEGNPVGHLLEVGLSHSAAYRLLDRLSKTLESVIALSITAASADTDKLAEAIVGRSLRC
ncbi:MAG: hypothetical protein AAF823_14405 [Planctomycetota bacterium]